MFSHLLFAFEAWHERRWLGMTWQEAEFSACLRVRSPEKGHFNTQSTHYGQAILIEAVQFGRAILSPFAGLFRMLGFLLSPLCV